jgi:hypothetical protein
MFSRHSCHDAIPRAFGRLVRQVLEGGHSTGGAGA